MKPIYKMENWGIVYTEQDPYKAPELRTQCLVGDRLGPGTDIKCVITTRIIGKSGNYIETKNTMYDLGTPDPIYEELYPNAKERLFATLPETK